MSCKNIRQKNSTQCIILARKTFKPRRTSSYASDFRSMQLSVKPFMDNVSAGNSMEKWWWDYGNYSRRTAIDNSPYLHAQGIFSVWCPPPLAPSYIAWSHRISARRHTNIFYDGFRASVSLTNVLKALQKCPRILLFMLLLSVCADRL